MVGKKRPRKEEYDSGDADDEDDDSPPKSKKAKRAGAAAKTALKALMDEKQVHGHDICKVRIAGKTRIVRIVRIMRIVCTAQTIRDLDRTTGDGVIKTIHWCSEVMKLTGKHVDSIKNSPISVQTYKSLRYLYDLYVISPENFDHFIGLKKVHQQNWMIQRSKEVLKALIVYGVYDWVQRHKPERLTALPAKYKKYAGGVGALKVKASDIKLPPGMKAEDMTNTDAAAQDPSKEPTPKGKKKKGTSSDDGGSGSGSDGGSGSGTESEREKPKKDKAKAAAAAKPNKPKHQASGKTPKGKPKAGSGDDGDGHGSAAY